VSPSLNRAQLWVVGDDVVAQLLEDWFAPAHIESIKGGECQQQVTERR